MRMALKGEGQGRLGRRGGFQGPTRGRRAGRAMIPRSCAVRDLEPTKLGTLQISEIFYPLTFLAGA
jgi:hypothetical protein